MSARDPTASTTGLNVLRPNRLERKKAASSRKKPTESCESLVRADSNG